MGWLPNPFGSPRRASSRPGYARSYAGSTYSSSHRASTSRYKRSPPRRLHILPVRQTTTTSLREIWRYAQRHPYKVFFMVIMPLVSGGVLHKLARQFGVNLTGDGEPWRGDREGAGIVAAGMRGGYYGSRGDNSG
ncbi:hypothetical protein SNOG_03527 [Parastagonospora nodorum SN15]|uniref:Uncharacterized protein n=1 Tax=Phaeosphaeria nodorum (strain SN15 / ATCC MYA-4574 / FGSC 10173) TaxID=321614 RepID=Q0UXI7_PHANO|nr:hypothetical protein SNOG_03527 [Parastagonospora nodorum SN15]EAT88732.1 hypothetical protein SNOG_03527 [Parastagonospora nodorum SN15]